jgi:hypothetical protein
MSQALVIDRVNVRYPPEMSIYRLRFWTVRPVGCSVIEKKHGRVSNEEIGENFSTGRERQRFLRLYTSEDTSPKCWKMFESDGRPANQG